MKKTPKTTLTLLKTQKNSVPAPFQIVPNVPFQVRERGIIVSHFETMPFQILERLTYAKLLIINLLNSQMKRFETAKNHFNVLIYSVFAVLLGKRNRFAFLECKGL
ncbi:hypothetical protein ACFSJU_14915 [Paradesertivirga mongoliensis]|uniref:Uncharacterized protein n=1 Tax=Paradesertivirga mongoliensis TaxID=2100740 RepID=A0ABW4ZNM1_9SPHI|nr:hypothetical protein [Pedobacter mongoliensis]